MKFGCEFKLTHIQDSTHFAEIEIPRNLVIQKGDVFPCIRLSLFEDLYVIAVLRRIEKATEDLIETCAESFGFIYAPEPLFGLPFDLRDRCNGDLFNQVFDYG
jgi:hypothetical protein